MSNYDNIPTQRIGAAENRTLGQRQANIQDISLSDGKTIPIRRSRTPLSGPGGNGADITEAPTVMIDEPPPPIPVQQPIPEETVRLTPMPNSDYPAPKEAPQGDPPTVVFGKPHARAHSSGIPVGSAATPISSDDYPMAFLVVIGGPMKGSSLIVRANQNSLGRASSNHICMSADERVSREGHCFITCLVDENEFYIRPGTGSGIVYLNNVLLGSQMPLKHGDLIRLTSKKVDSPTVLRFYPVIDDDYQWEI